MNKTKGRYYSICLKGGDVFNGFIHEPEVIDSFRDAPPGEWVWFNDTDGTVWIRAGEVQSIFIGREGHEPN